MGWDAAISEEARNSDAGTWRGTLLIMCICLFTLSVGHYCMLIRIQYVDYVFDNILTASAVPAKSEAGILYPATRWSSGSVKLG